MSTIPEEKPPAETAYTQTHKDWANKFFRDHFQAAVDVELWTIPFYMSAMYSIKDKNSEAYQLIRTVINQEMLHLQCAANIANAFGLSPTITAPKYEKNKIPHLNLQWNPSEATQPYEDHDFSIGPLDLTRVNAMCLVELPETETPPLKLLVETLINQYSSIGTLYTALRHITAILKQRIKGGVRQVDSFSAFYRNMPNMVVSESGELGFDQVGLLINLITDQGEGDFKIVPDIEHVFQNTADDGEPSIDHFEKFNQIKNDVLPKIFAVTDPSNYSPAQKLLEDNLITQFSRLTDLLESLFKGENPENFFPIMASVGAAIRNCWEHGVTPKYS